MKYEEKNFARICYGDYSDQYVEIHKKFKCIIMVDKKFVNNVYSPFLNRFEKMIISFKNLLDESQKKLYEELKNNDLNLNKKIKEIKEENNLYINLEYLLIGCKNEDIQGLIYSLSDGKNLDDSNEKEDVKQKIFNKNIKFIASRYYN